MIVSEKKLPYNSLDKQIDLAGNREFYKVEYSEIEDSYIWDSEFVKKLDKFLVKGIELTKSEARAINEWLDHEDSFMPTNKKPTTHEQRVLESLDVLFLDTTLKMGFK